MQAAINNFFENIFGALTNFLGGYVLDPGTKWGLAIILFTFLFNLIVFPLNWKAMMGTKKMGEIQPLLKEIQDKYKNDPVKMQQEQQRIFKENNVSMLGGCLPMLIQWPLFIAMFGVFRALSVPGGTLSGLSFLPPLIPDLSASGNIVLTVLTVATMLGTQYLTMKGQKNSAQGSQNLVMTIVMSLMMAFFTFTQSAALGLYWVTSNLFRLIQQFIMNEVDKRNRGEVA